MTDLVAPQRAQLPAAPDGVVLLDKPVGLSSNVALQKVKRLLGARKAGHTGSLDPLASGLLPICLGQATRFSGYLLEAAKGYRVRARLGARTATGDAEGEVVEHCAWEQLTRADLEAVLESFRGPIQQVPPMYSALKQGGERLYRKARRGEEVERAPRAIVIYRLEIVEWQPPEFALEVDCSKGTYIRTLVEDVARAAGSCAHVAALRRVRAGPFGEKEMLGLDALADLVAQGPAALATAVHPAESALAALPALSLPADDVRRVCSGQVIEAAGDVEGVARAYGPDGFIGLVERNSAGGVRAVRLLETSGAQLR